MKKNLSSTIYLLSALWKNINSKRKRQFKILLILMIISGIAEVFSIASVVPFLTALTNPENLLNQKYIQSLMDFFKLNNNQIQIFAILIFAFIAILANGIKIINLKLNSILGALVGNDLSNKIYKNHLNQSYLYHINRNSSEVTTNIIRYVDEVTAIIIVSLQGLTSIVLASFIFTSLLIYNWYVSIFILLIIGFTYLAIGFFFRKRLLKNSMSVAKLSKMQVKTLQESLGSIREIILSNNQNFYTKIFWEIDKPLRLTKADNIFIAGSPRYLLEASALILLSIVTFLLISLGTFSNNLILILGTFAFSAQRLLPTIQLIYSSWSDIKSSKDAVLEVCKFLEQPIPKESNYKNLKNLDIKKSLVLKSINFIYPSTNIEVLKSINIEIKKGEIIGIRGPTGSGKSTIINLLMGLLIPTNGELLLDDVSLLKPKNYKKLLRWRNSISHVPQKIFLADSTIAENIAFGIRKEEIDFKKLEIAAKKANIYNYIKSKPLEFNTPVGELGIKLSGGQQQRIGIARALYRNSSFLVLDEATSALDQETESIVINNIKALKEEFTIIMIAHRLNTLTHCDKVFEITNGQISNVQSGFKNF